MWYGDIVTLAIEWCHMVCQNSRRAIATVVQVASVGHLPTMRRHQYQLLQMVQAEVLVVVEGCLQLPALTPIQLLQLLLLV
jgi:hypothetical protein